MARTELFLISIVALLIAPTVASSATEAEPRVESQPYVAQWTTECGVNKGLHRAMVSAMGEERADALPWAPGGPVDATPAEQPCFWIQPGETTVTLSVADEAATSVRYWVGVSGEQGGWQISESYCSDEDVTLALPEGATRLAVTVYPTYPFGCPPPGTATLQLIVGAVTPATTGTVRATFS